MSFANAAKAAKAVAERAAPLAAGTAAVLAAQPAAQAREIQQAGPSSAISRIARIQDDFELVDFDGTKPIFTKPVFSDDEIAAATQSFRALVSCDDEPDTDTSDGTAADAVIESSPPFGLPAASAPRPALVDMGMVDLRQEEMRAALQIANRVLRYPGVQREIAAAALSDPEVLQVLGAQPDLDKYLLTQGFAARGLLPTADGPAAALAAPRVTELPSDDEAAAGGADDAGVAAARDAARAAAERRRARRAAAEKDPLVQLIEGVVKGIEWTGARIAEFGDWLRDRIAPPPPPPAAAVNAAEAAAEGAKGAKGAARGAGGPDARARRIMERAGQVAVLLVLLIVFRRAGVIFRRA